MCVCIYIKINYKYVEINGFRNMSFQCMIGIAIGIKLTTLGYKTIYARFKKLDRVSWFN